METLQKKLKPVDEEAETERETRRREIQPGDRRIFCPSNGDFSYDYWDLRRFHV